MERLVDLHVVISQKLLKQGFKLKQSNLEA